MTTAPADPPSPHEIADLTAWLRRLTEAGPAADPAERRAFQAAKNDLLARLPGYHPDRHADPEEQP